MYGSIFWSVTLKPRASRSAPIDAAASPLPRDDTTPPVTKMYLGGKSPLLSGFDPCADERFFLAPCRDLAVEPRVPQGVERRGDARPRRDAERDHLVAAQRRARA